LVASSVMSSSYHVLRGRSELDRYASSKRYRVRRELIEQMAARYRASSRAQKSRMLDAVVAVTGSARTYAIQLFNQLVEPKPRIQRPRLPHYGSEVQRALILAWTAANQICSKRLIPFLPTLVEATSAARASPPDAGVPESTARDECRYGGASPTLPAHTPSAGSVHDASGHPAQTSHSDPHICRLE
jgi:hypothetical protein